MNAAELLTLWHGDPDTTGYQHAGLVAEVCAQRRIRTIHETIQTFYPGRQPADLDAETRGILEAGLRLHEARLALPRRH